MLQRTSSPETRVALKLRRRLVHLSSATYRVHAFDTIDSRAGTVDVLAAGGAANCTRGSLVAKHANAAPMSGPSQLFEAACFARSTGEPRTALPAIDACTPRSRSGPLRSACFSSSNATQALGPTWQGMDAQSSQSVLGDGLAAHAGDGGLATASLSYGHWPLSQHSIALPARPRCSTAGTRGLHWQVPRASPSGLAGRFAS